MVEYVGDQPPDAYMLPGMALHMMYGIGAGAAFAVGATALGLGVGVGALTGSVLWAVAYALVLTVVGAVFWMRVVLAMEPEPAIVGMFAFFHIVYGAVLGASVASIPL